MTTLVQSARPRSPFVSAWFVLDAFLGMFPPVYWIAGGSTPLIFGVPCSIVYYVLLAAFITGSIITAYIDDERRGAFNQ